MIRQYKNPQKKGSNHLLPLYPYWYVKACSDRIYHKYKRSYYMPEDLHKGKSNTGPKSNGSETPVMPCRTFAPFLLSNKTFDRVFDGCPFRREPTFERGPGATIQRIDLLTNL